MGPLGKTVFFLMKKISARDINLRLSEIDSFLGKIRDACQDMGLVNKNGLKPPS